MHEPLNPGSALRASSRQRGFSLIELMIVCAILVIVLGVIFRQITVIQMRSRAEQTKLDMTQQARESLDQMVRDIHQSGYPSMRMGTQALIGVKPTYNYISLGYAAGLILINSTPPELRFEGDVDGSGTISNVRYRYVTTSPESSHCPCIERSQKPKVSADLVTGQVYEYHVMVENLAPNGLSFTAFDKNGNVVPIGMYGLNIDANAATLATIRSIQITMNVVGQSLDLQTAQFPAVQMTSLAQLRNFHD